MSDERLSIALETSCRAGSIALGRGDRMLAVERFDARARHATQLVMRLRELLSAHDVKPADLDEVYVSVGPGSFTGLRVGITTARTLAQAVSGLRCVAVSTARVIAENVRPLDWTHLAVVLDARAGSVHATTFRRSGQAIEAMGPGGVVSVERFVSEVPKPVLVIGEGLAHEQIAGEGITPADPQDEALHRPTAENVWKIGFAMARAGDFIEYHHLLPQYARQPEALRVWQERNGK